MKKFKKALLCVVMSFLFVVNSIVPTLPAITAYAAATDMDASYKSTANPPQSITGKTDIATWSYIAPFTNPNLGASSGYYKTTPDGTNSTLQLFKNNIQFTGAYSTSASTFSTNGFNGSTDKGFWLIKTSTNGFKDLVFNFVTRSSNTGPRDFNTEWSIDGINWNVFGNTAASTGCTVKIESTSPAEQFGMVLPTGAENQSTLYIRILQKSETSVNGTTVVSG